MLDLRRLQVLKAVADAGSFSAAALDLSYTQSSVSQHVTKLEQELGVTLIDRGARPVAPTPAGHVVLRGAEEMLGRGASIERELAALSAGEVGHLRVGGFSTAWATFMPNAVAAYSRQRPGVQLELRTLEPEPAIRQLRAGELDLAVTYRFAELTEPPDETRFEWAHLLDDAHAVALPRRHRLAAKTRVSLRDLRRERWVSPPRDAPYTRVLFRLCREHGGFEPDVAYETIDVAMAQPLVASGLAVGLLPSLALRPRHEGVVVKPLPSVPPARTVEVGRVRGVANPTAAPMVDALRTAALRRVRG